MELSNLKGIIVSILAPFFGESQRRKGRVRDGRGGRKVADRQIASAKSEWKNVTVNSAIYFNRKFSYSSIVVWERRRRREKLRGVKGKRRTAMATDPSFSYSHKQNDRDSVSIPVPFAITVFAVIALNTQRFSGEMIKNK